MNGLLAVLLEFSCTIYRFFVLQDDCSNKQDGNRPSRRRAQGTKVQQGAWLYVENQEKCYTEKKSKNLTAPKKSEGRAFPIYKTFLLPRNRKITEGGTLCGKKKIRKKVAQCRKKLKGGTP